jgi:hypothetical protein
MPVISDQQHPNLPGGLNQIDHGRRGTPAPAELPSVDVD